MHLLTDEISEDCQLWPGGHYRSGYAKCKRKSPFSIKVYTRVSRWILAIKLGRDLSSEEYAMHTCDNPPCVNKEHIVLGSAVLNNRDTVNKGRWRDGRWNKISREDREDIRTKYATGDSTQQELALEYDVSQNCISKIVRRHKNYA